MSWGHHHQNSGSQRSGFISILWVAWKSCVSWLLPPSPLVQNLHSVTPWVILKKVVSGHTLGNTAIKCAFNLNPHYVPVMEVIHLSQHPSHNETVLHGSHHSHRIRQETTKKRVRNLLLDCSW
jgi:hypothetical protein